METPPVKNEPQIVNPHPASSGDTANTRNGKIDINNYEFQSEFPSKKKKKK